MSTKYKSKPDIDNNKIKAQKALIFFAAALFWLLPCHPALLSNQPAILDPLNTLIISLLWFPVFAMHWTRVLKWHLLILALCFLVPAFLGIVHHTHRTSTGLSATYYPNSSFSEPAAEFVTRASTDSTVRLDQPIDFSSDGFSFFEQTFPLYFANDALLRFWTADSTDIPAAFQFSAIWEGYIVVNDAVSQISLIHTGGALEWFLDGKEVIGQAKPINSSLKKWLPIQIRFSRSNAQPPSLQLEWLRAGILETVPSTALKSNATQNQDSHTLQLVSYLAAGIWFAALLAFIWLVRPRWKPPSTNLVLWSVFVGLSLIVVGNVQQFGEQFGSSILNVGNDDLTYESSARDLLLGHWWDNNKGQLLYQNLAYPYLLAAMHLIAGESVGQAIWFQQWLMSGMLIFMTWLIYRLYGTRPAVIMFVLLSVTKIIGYSKVLLDTTFAISIGFCVIYCLLRYVRQSRIMWLLLGGLALGIATLVRMNFLAFVPVAAIWLVLYSPSSRVACRNLLIFLLSFLLMFSFVGIRNQIVANDIVLLPSSGGLNLWIGNHPPEFDGPTYFTTRVPRDADLLSLAKNYIFDDPIAFFQRTGKKLAYVFGVNLKKGEVKVRVFLLWLFAIIVTFLTVRKGCRQSDNWLLWGWVVSINAPLVLIFPWGYGWRLSAPSFPILCLIIAIGVSAILDRQVASR
ncbi:MAG: glycosyltransferase family 39 protein [Methylococcales bacterium]